MVSTLDCRRQRGFGFIVWASSCLWLNCARLRVQGVPFVLRLRCVPGTDMGHEAEMQTVKGSGPGSGINIACYLLVLNKE